MPTSTCISIWDSKKIIAFQSTDMRNFTCGFLPAQKVGFPKSILEDSWRLMINDESTWNFLVNENNYKIFPLALNLLLIFKIGHFFPLKCFPRGEWGGVRGENQVVSFRWLSFCQSERWFPEISGERRKTYGPQVLKWLFPRRHT